jgi:hypothetical protein
METKLAGNIKHIKNTGKWLDIIKALAYYGIKSSGRKQWPITWKLNRKRKGW